MANRNADTYGDTAELATSISYDTVVEGWIDATVTGSGVVYDDDWFSFTASEGNDYKITFNNNGVDQFIGNTYFPLNVYIEVKGYSPPGSFNTTNIEVKLGTFHGDNWTTTVTPDLSNYKYNYFDGNYYVKVAHSVGPAYSTIDVPYDIKVEKIVQPPDPLPPVVAPNAGTPEAALYSKDDDGNALRQADRVITYYFDNGGSGNSSDGPWTADEREAVEQAMARIAKYVDISFQEVTDVAQADWDLEIFNDDAGLGILGYFDMPGEAAPQKGLFYRNGKGWDENGEGGLDVGGHGFGTVIHELLHGLGLSHSFDTGNNSEKLRGVVVNGKDMSTGDYGLNQEIHTAMSYVRQWSQVPYPLDDSYGDVATPMALDLAVLKRLYGLNDSVENGDTTYMLPGGNFTGTFFQCIYDTGGTDTIKTATGGNGYVDLRPATLNYETGGGGFVSYTIGVSGGFTIANGVKIENAEGTYNHDTLYGNDYRNELVGMGGHDKLFGRGAGDTLDGGKGEDTLYGQGGSDFLIGGSGNDSLLGSSGDNTLKGGAGDDSLHGDRNDDRLYGDTGNDLLSGQAGTDRLLGGAGKDTIKGGADRDTLFGADDNDKLYGDAKNDQLFGEDGKDRLYGGDGHDKLIGGNQDDGLKGDKGNDTLEGGNHDDTLLGGADGDLLKGGGGKDQLRGDAGDDRIIGGGGTDMAIFSGKIGRYDVVKAGSKIKVIDSSGKFGTDTLSSVEKLKFGGKVYSVKKALKVAAPAADDGDGIDEDPVVRGDGDWLDVTDFQFETLHFETDDLLA